MNSNNNDKYDTSFSTYNTNDEYHSEFGNVNESTVSSTCNNLLHPVNKLHNSVAVSSPTGSGKTVIFELAIIRFLETLEKCSNSLENSKIIYVAPIKALCSERHTAWKNKFSSHGIKCVEIAGDSEISDDIYLLNNYQLIITTPEKWDSLTRKCKELKYQLCMVKLFLIDEVHLINEGNRGATLETIVSRMKMISKMAKTTKLDEFKLRFVALSATVSNIEDIAKWLSSDQKHSAYYLKNNENERAVKLEKIVIGYDYQISNFKFDLDLTYELMPLIRQYSNGWPTLIFCATKKSVEFTCRILVKDITTSMGDDKKECINEILKEINNNKIKEFVKLGVGCYHTGMSFQERNALEHLFRIGCLNILVATSTLAMGVNLPAHLVIIKSTEHYTFNGYTEYNECQILQMVGRAGRPQFDTTATVIIMTKKSMKNRYEEILIGNQVVESHLHKHLIEHLNAEIFLGTIYDIMDWIRSTFLYVRACKAPQKYGMNKTLSVNEIECTLQNICLMEIKALESTGLINCFNINNKITSKPEGEIMAKYSISFITMKLFMQLKGTESLSDIIRLLSNAKEFENIKLRRFEKEMLNSLNKNKLPGADVIRFPIEEGINTRETKINCLLQATLGTLTIKSNSLAQEASKIILIALRLTKALREITYRGTQFEIARVSCILVKCVTTRLWEQSKFVSKLIPKIGPVLSRELVLNGKTTFQSIKDTNPRDLERFLHRRPPFGNRIHDFIHQIPKYKVQVCFDEHSKLVLIKIILTNHKNIPKNTRFHAVSILVGDSDNRLLKVQQIRNEEFFEQGIIHMTVTLKNQVLVDKSNYDVTICLISDQWVGIDVQIKFKPINLEEHVNESISKDNCIDNSPSEDFPSPQPTEKMQTSTVAVNQKIQNRGKTQISIKQFLHNVPSKDQDPKVINKLHLGENRNIYMKCDESSVATQQITCKVIETQTNSLNNGHTNEYIKFDKDNLNKYFYYDELINVDVFHDLFIPDNSFHDISKAFDSAIEKCCLRENTKQIKYFNHRIQHEVIKPNESQCITDNNKLLINDEFCFKKTCVINSNGIEPQYLKQCNRNYLNDFDDKENVNPYKSEQTLTWHRSDNDNVFKSDTCKTLSEANIPLKNQETSSINMAAIGRLSRRIATNLKASSDFYVPLDNEIQLEIIADKCCEKNTSVPIGSEQTRSNRIPTLASVRTTPIRKNGKLELDKYFKAIKTSRRLQSLNVNRFMEEETPVNDLTKFSIKGSEPSMNALQIDTNKTPLKKTNLMDDKFFDRNIAVHGYNKACNSENSSTTDTSTEQPFRYYFPPLQTNFKND